MLQDIQDLSSVHNDNISAHNDRNDYKPREYTHDVVSGRNSQGADSLIYLCSSMHTHTNT